MAINDEWELIKFIWKIENFSYIKNEERLESPSFGYNSPMWEIIFVKTNSYISFELQKLICLRCLYNCSFALLDSDGTPMVWKEKKKIVSGYIKFEYFIKIDMSNKAKYLSNDALTIQCQIWRPSYVFTTIPVSRFARTRIEPTAKLIQKTLTWEVVGVSSLQSHQSFERSETISDGESFTIRLSLNKDDEFQVVLKTTLPRIQMKIKIAVLDVSGRKIEFANCEGKFKSKSQNLDFSTNVTKAMLMFYPDKFLHADTLSLHFTCTFLGNINFNRMVDENEILVDFPVTTAAVSNISEASMCGDEPETPSTTEPHPPNTISQTLQDMFNDGFLSDFNLRVRDRVFPVHRSILGMRSPVFRAMFTTEMKEKEDNCVDIQDVDEHTLQRLLQFVYSDKIDEDMGWENASSLYAAADKYALDPLKQGCTAILQSELCVSSVLEVLSLSDMHQDQDLKSTALEFISLNDQDIVGTECWNKFEKENAKLALDTFHSLYLKKMNG